LKTLHFSEFVSVSLVNWNFSTCNSYDDSFFFNFFLNPLTMTWQNAA